MFNMRCFLRFFLISIIFFSTSTICASLEVLVEATGDLSGLVLSKIRHASDVIANSIPDSNTLDKKEMGRLFKNRIQDAILSTLASEGYFSPTLILDSIDTECKVWKILINPGQQILISNINLEVSGLNNQTQSHVSLNKKINALRTEWALQIGKPFNNAQWGKTKTYLLSEIASKDFPLAYIVESSAIINISKTGVNLSVHINCGPRVMMGSLNTYGFNKTPRNILNRYIKYNKGDSFDQKLLDNWKRNLQLTGFFRGVFISLDDSGSEDPYFKESIFRDMNRFNFSGESPKDPLMDTGSKNESHNLKNSLIISEQSEPEITLPIKIQVIEAPAKRFALSVGIDDDSGLQLESLYRHNITTYRDLLILSTGLAIDRFHQRAFVDIDPMPSSSISQRRNALGFLIDCSDIQEVKVKRLALGVTHIKQTERSNSNQVKYESHIETLLAYDWVQRNKISFKLPAAIGNFEWIRSNLDSSHNPCSGNSIVFEFSAGITLDEINFYAKSKLRLQKWWPLGQSDFFHSKAEIGRVWLNNSSINHVPNDFGFRIGGAHSIRGYTHQSIGVRRGDAIIGGSRLALLSLEYNHRFKEKLGLGLFIELGDANDTIKIKDMAIGYGIGVRFQTLAGPLLLDLAYGTRDKKFRSHFSIGISL